MTKQDSEKNKQYSNLGTSPKLNEYIEVNGKKITKKEFREKQLDKKYKKSTESMEKGEKPKPFSTIFSHDPTYIPTPTFKNVNELYKKKLKKSSELYKKLFKSK